VHAKLTIATISSIKNFDIFKKKENQSNLSDNYYKNSDPFMF